MNWLFWSFIALLIILGAIMFGYIDNEITKGHAETLRTWPHELVIHDVTRDVTNVGITLPTATHAAIPTDTPEPVETPTPGPVMFAGTVTHYGEQFNGQTMACGGIYSSDRLDIAAVAYPSRTYEWPCGTRFVVSGPAGVLEVQRTDSCPGCASNQLDLSESGMLRVCGYLGRCDVEIGVLP